MWVARAKEKKNELLVPWKLYKHKGRKDREPRWQSITRFKGFKAVGNEVLPNRVKVPFTFQMGLLNMN